MISIDPHSVYHFGYPLFLVSAVLGIHYLDPYLQDLTNKVNSFDDLKK